MVVYLFNKYPPAPKLRVGGSVPAGGKPAVACVGQVKPARVVGVKNNINKISKPKQYLVKTPSSSYFIYHFKNLNLFVKAKPRYRDFRDFQPEERELKALNLEAVSKIFNTFEVIPC